MSMASIGAAVAGAAVGGGLSMASNAMNKPKGTTTKTQALLSPEQQQIFQAIWPHISSLSGSAKTWKPYAGKTLADVTPNQQIAQNQYLDAAGNLQGFGDILRSTTGNLAGTVDSNYAGLPAYVKQLGEAGMGTARTATSDMTGNVNSIYGGLQGQIGGAQNQLLSASDVTHNPALDKAIQAGISPLAYNFSNVVMPAIRNHGIATGLPGSSREGVAEANAIHDFQTQAGNISATMANEGYKAGLGAQTAAVANAGNIANAQAGNYNTAAGTGLDAILASIGQAMTGQTGVVNDMTQNLINATGTMGNNAGAVGAASLLPAQITEGVGAQQQGQSQAQLDDAANRYYMKTQYPMQIASQFMGMLSQMPGGSGVSTATGPMPQTNPINGALGGGMLGLQLANMLRGQQANQPAGNPTAVKTSSLGGVSPWTTALTPNFSSLGG